jgi:CBS domain-containing protein
MSTLKTTQKARDVMAAEPLLVEASTTIRQLARILSASTISEAPVVNREGTLIGFVSKTDLLRACSGASADGPPAYLFDVAFEQDGREDDESDAMAKPLGDGARFLNHGPVTVTPDTSITRIASLMRDGRIHRIIVLEPEKLPAILVTTFDLSEVVSQ